MKIHTPAAAAAVMAAVLCLLSAPGRAFESGAVRPSSGGILRILIGTGLFAAATILLLIGLESSGL